MALTVNVTALAEGVVLLGLSGRLDASAAADFEVALLPHAENAAVTRVILDGAGLEYVASAGLRAILKAIKAMTPRKAILYGVGLTPTVVAVLKMTGFLAFVQLRGSIDECLS